MTIRLLRTTFLALAWLLASASLADVGQEMYDKFEAEGAFYDDPELQAYIDRVGQRLVANSDMPDKSFTFSVLDSPDINAFATPGGFIYINRGLLAYLDNEAELAGVLAHEIGHVTGRHHSRRKTAGVTSQVIATTVGILTGSRDIMDASTMVGAELISGYGRDMELEADGLGAEYMHRSGYDVDALLEVIGVLKDQEQFQRVKAKQTGRPVKTYHGLYATHPRNDKRLQTVVRAANELPLDEYVENPEIPGEFRQHVNGLVWGASIQGRSDPDRFYHSKLSFSFKHPPGWTVDAGAQSITTSAPDNSASVTITLRRRDGNASPRSVLEGGAGGSLSQGRELEQYGLKGYTALASSGSTSKRLAVIDYNYTYLFEGAAKDLVSADADLLGVIESFRPLQDREKQSGKPLYVRYLQVPRGATLASLASSLRIPDAEAQLRLINGFYPRGEPRTGDWIKIIQ